MNVDSDDDFQPPIKSVYNYVAPKDLFQDLKKRSGKGTSYKPKKNLPKKCKDLDAPGPSTAPRHSTAVSTPADNFDAILLAMSPEEVEGFLNTFRNSVPSLNLAKPASSSDSSISETADINTGAPAPKASDETDTDDKKAKDASKSMKCSTCGGTDHARSSSKNCSERVKGKKEGFQEFTKTTAIKTSLINCCKYESAVSKIQKLVTDITQVVFVGSIFANYYYLDQIQNKEVPSEINQNLIYQLFSVLTGQGKKANDELQACFEEVLSIVT
ncbi:hypothetical protein [Parasitella parasitica]|uniref:Uncharacterized protein n=1 Tax=Parasitella parasitica TaxID=35722 RepID=A0A0B7MV87_9FUNG|nr:hypothetical protein [Parasitella parasitica]